MLNGLLSSSIPRSKNPTSNYNSLSYVSNDPYFSNVVLFLKGDGANNSTTIIDSSPNPKTITRFGDTKILTAQNKYGGSSIYFDGNGDYLQISNSADFAFGTDDFTIETWILIINDSGAGYSRIVHSDSFPANGGWFLVSNYGNSTNNTPAFHNGSNSVNAVSSAVISLGSWTHISVTRSSGTIRLFLNGVQRGSVSMPESFTNQGCYVGGRDTSFKGYIDSLRITKGVARYTANFNPETDTYFELLKPSITIKSKVPSFLSRTYV